MVIRSVALATEDELSETIGIRLLAEMKSPLKASLLLRKNGFGYLRSKMNSWCEISSQQPVILLTDLDEKACASALIDDWFGQRYRPKNFLFRIAVREIESWLLADHDAMRSLLGNKGKLPENPDDLDDPKRYLITLAKNAKRDVRSDLVAVNGAIATQGAGYNARLCEVIRTQWSPVRAAARSASLRRAMNRINELSTRLSDPQKGRKLPI